MQLTVCLLIEMRDKNRDVMYDLVCRASFEDDPVIRDPIPTLLFHSCTISCSNVLLLYMFCVVLPTPMLLYQNSRGPPQTEKPSSEELDIVLCTHQHSEREDSDFFCRIDCMMRSEMLCSACAANKTTTAKSESNFRPEK